MASAITTAASLAERVTRPLMASSTLMVWPGRRPSLVGACSEANSDTSISRIELHLAGFEALEQQIERHDLGQRSRAPDTVGIVRGEHRAGIGVDDDRGELRAVAFADDVMATMLVAARVGALAADQDRCRDGNEPQRANPQRTRGSEGCTKHLLPRPNFYLDHRLVRQNCAQQPLTFPAQSADPAVSSGPVGRSGRCSS